VDILSPSEIRNDLKEMMAKVDGSADTDSDGSVASDTIVLSHYPVKPRKTLRPVSKDMLLNRDDDAPNRSVDDGLNFVKQLSHSHKQLLESEMQREEWEISTKVGISPFMFSTDKVIFWDGCWIVCSRVSWPMPMC
jgi:hypothetical protein